MSATETASNATKTGFPILGILTIVFVIAKIIHLIAWPWWLVFLPLYGPLALVLAVGAVLVVLAGACAIGAALIDATQAAKRQRRISPAWAQGASSHNDFRRPAYRA